jgi:trimeric autotransporter adhesin
MLFDNNSLGLSFSAIGVITSVAGNGGQGTSGDGGQATSARLSQPQGVAVNAIGNIYIADAFSHRIRMVTKSTGVITTVAGTGEFGYSGDGGLATLARLNSPQGVAVDASGNIYIADMYNNRIRMVTGSPGVITTVAGTGTTGYSGDGGQATLAVLNLPMGVAVDASGKIFIADTKNNRIRMVTMSSGVITTVAGNGTAGYSGDGGQATSAGLSYPYGIAVDLSGIIYISDQKNDRVRMVTSTGLITTVAGNGFVGTNIGDGGLATSAVVIAPYGIAVDALGNLYITRRGSNDNRIRKVTKSTGIITTLAGNGTAGYSGDGGQATSAKLSGPNGVAVDASGNVYIADSLNYRVRMFATNEMPTSAPSAAPTPTPSPSTAPISTHSPSTAPISTPSPSAVPTAAAVLIPISAPSAVPTSTPSPSAEPSSTSVPSTVPATSLIASIPTSSSSTLSTNVISGVIGGVGGLLLILLVLVVICCCRRR